MAEELEVTLRICSEDPEGVFRDIAMARRIGSYELIYRERFSLHDQYFDTPQKALAGKGYALRLRTEGKRRILGLKGNESINEWGAVQRTEVEGPWSKDMLSQILATLGTIPFSGEAFDPDDPVKTLNLIGLEAVQSRKTERTLLDVVFKEVQDHPVIGVMALDRVCYVSGRKNFLHYEIEVEAAEGKDRVYVREFVYSLLDALPDDLCRWDYNKLITGCALEALIERGDLSPASRSGDLVPQAWYRAIEEWIRQNLRPAQS